MGPKFSNIAHSHDLMAFSLAINHDLLNHFPDVVYKCSVTMVALDVNRFTLYSNALCDHIIYHPAGTLLRAKGF